MGILLFLVAVSLIRFAHADRINDVLIHKSDPLGYYHYLPALLGTHEWANLPHVIMVGYHNGVSVFTSGVAWMQAPFFGIAAIVARVSGQPVDGYSLPFVHARFVASAFYLALGSVFLFLALRRNYSSRVALIVPLVLFSATNLYFYVVYDPGMSHIYSYALIAWLYYLTVRMVERPRADRLAGMIALAGMITLVRPLNAVVLLFPLLYGARPGEAIKERLRWVARCRLGLIAGLGLVLVAWVPQLLYWKHATGKWFVFTYGLNGQGFDWQHPHLMDVLLSHQNGWFVYTPLMAVVTMVLLWHARRGTANARTIAVICALVWYSYASWWCWWLGGSFGHRGFVEYYALLALPLARALEWLMRRPRRFQEMTFVGIGVLAFLNIRMSHLYQWPWEGPEWTWQKVGDVCLKALLG